jgi:hypothetical protein
LAELMTLRAKYRAELSQKKRARSGRGLGPKYKVSF